MTMRLVSLAVLAGLLLCGCRDADPGYTPKKAEALIAEIEAIEGVTTVDIGALESAGVGGSRPTYNGQVRIGDGADPVQVLDQVLAILWQGMPDAALDVEIRQQDTFYGTASVGLGEDRLEERYGPQPGTGKPPTDQPALELRN